ncbi:MBL fold metallo-hydrolase [Celeribacter indicus]|uniref:Beta-lactamase domain-containing protein n=1 Tax=Celeribacter indicus TaxID=1208324 RepID=A0A0B5DXT9_9RHOB|nr:MBL fold metallo-hydrolase [Celeribacter indicus]AJE45940.1 beta-lactamase domain-containing protein [Celeribacter indicus]SDW64258.1 Glyoxylase, beta-lactamase superfamily II [Celeribacter indicus]
MKIFPASGKPGSPDVAAFYEKTTGSWQYVASDPATKAAVIVDPVLDFSPEAGATWTASADEILAYVREERLNVLWVLDTHPHADHFSAAHYLATELSVPQAIGEKVLEVQDLWADLYAEDDLAGHPEYWERLFRDGDRFDIGDLAAEVILSTGHTLASVSYRIGDAIFAHDTFMMPDSGTARADFPGGSTGELWDTLQTLLALPGDTRVFVGHDYGKDGRDPDCMAVVAEHRRANIHVKDGTDREEFVALRAARDATLPLPKQMLHALQVNIRGGRLPEPDGQGRAVFRIPVNRFAPQA